MDIEELDYVMDVKKVLGHSKSALFLSKIYSLWRFLCLCLQCVRMFKARPYNFLTPVQGRSQLWPFCLGMWNS